MHKLFKPRTIRRILLLLALAFPIVYLMGSAFFALNGSHGNVLLAQEEDVVTSSKVVDFNQVIRNGLPESADKWFAQSANVSMYYSTGGYLVVSSTTAFESVYQNLIAPLNSSHVYFSSITARNLNTSSSLSLQFYNSAIGLFTPFAISESWATYDRVFTFGNPSYTTTQFFVTGTSNNFSFAFKNLYLVDLTQMYGAGNEPTVEQFRAIYSDSYYDFTLSTKLVEETTETPTYSEYLFNQVFGHDNIVSQLGYYALSEEQKGFAPVSALVRFVDDNILHWGDGNALAVFSYGYVYYAINTLIVYEIVIIATKLLLLPLKAVDVFDRKGEYDD